MPTKMELEENWLDNMGEGPKVGILEGGWDGGDQVQMVNDILGI